MGRYVASKNIPVPVESWKPHLNGPDDGLSDPILPPPPPRDTPPAPPRQMARIRIDGLYGLRKGEVMVVEDANDCDGSIIILKGCWKFFAVPKEDKGVGWEFVDLPPTCINPRTCSNHYGDQSSGEVVPYAPPPQKVVPP